MSYWRRSRSVLRGKLEEMDQPEQDKKRNMRLFVLFVLCTSAVICTLTYVGYIHKVFKFGP